MADAPVVAIRFYETGKPNGYMSNFSRHGFYLDGHHWPTSEHYFQALKHSNPNGTLNDYCTQIRNAATPAEAAKLGRSRAHPVRRDWDQVKEEVMMRALRAKFAAHADIRNQLIETAPRELIEHTDKDNYWADGGDGTGRNRLGVLLGVLRGELIAARRAA